MKLESSKKHDTIFSIFINAFFLIIVLIVLIPFALLFLSSFHPGNDLMRYGLNFSLNPDSFTLNNYRLLFEGDNNYFFWFRNSVVITLIQVAFTLFLSSAVGYAFGVYQFKYKNIIFLAVLIVMMIPTEIILLPLYRLISVFKLIDSKWGVILPYIVSPVLIFFFRQYSSGIPKDFLDAARIDGCTEYGIYFKIMVPILKPAFAAMAINQGMNSWNNFLWPMIVLRSPQNITLPVGLQSLMSPYGNNYDLLLAGSVIAVLPILILFLLLQKYFITGLTAGGVKG